jgi:non-ribosomal peptide synthetase component F
MTLLTSFQFLLACLTGDDDVVVGSPTAGRSHSETENLIGYFVNTLVLRTRMEGALTFRKALRQVRDTAMDAFAHQDVPFEKLVDELGAERSLEFNPLFQVWFVLQNTIVEREEWRDLKVEPITIESSSTRHDLQLTMWENEKEIEGAFTYSTDLFDAESIGRFAEQFRVLLSHVADDPELTLSELRLRLAQAARDYEQQRAARLTDDSREKLRSVKRRAVTGTSSATLEA